MIETITVWLLISMSSLGYAHQRPVTLVERFATLSECQRIQDLVRTEKSEGITRCVQATIVKP